jgi:hypothetical protein
MRCGAGLQLVELVLAGGQSEGAARSTDLPFTSSGRSGPCYSLWGQDRVAPDTHACRGGLDQINDRQYLGSNCLCKTNCGAVAQSLPLACSAGLHLRVNYTSNLLAVPASGLPGWGQLGFLGSLDVRIFGGFLVDFWWIFGGF